MMMDMKHTDKELIKAFVEECKWDQYSNAKFKENHIEFDNYFKYSGEIEEYKVLITHYKYNENSRCNDLHEQFIKTKDYEKIWEENKKYSGKFTEELEAYYREKATDRVWYDKI